MMKVYLVSTGLSLASTLIAGYKWSKLGMKKPNLLVPAILSVIPIIQWIWLMASVATIVVGEKILKNIKETK